ncbi:MAG: hypothetical protein ABSG95_03210 [Solirubrobacteraceae bacterium]|jgi:hypothetical protein
MADSKALADLRKGLKAVDDVLSYVKTSAGKPSKPEQSLFVASVALSYAMWENYVEEVAIEAATLLGRDIKDADVPRSVRDWILKSNPTAWDIAVYPGWRALWLKVVTERAKGGSGADDLGMNTANTKNVRSLFERVGVDPFATVPEEHLDKLEQLVKERGEIVHTGKAPKDFYKENATGWRAFVDELAAKVDGACAAGAKALVGKNLW